MFGSDDITWCASKCSNTNCFRHPTNMKHRVGLHSYAEFKNTEDCPFSKTEVTIQERGWAGHFIMSRNCLFRRNTLISHSGTKWIVSTVGACINQIDTPFAKAGEIQEIGPGRYYETMAFESKYDVYDDANIEKPIHFESKWAICGDSWSEVLEKYNEYPDVEANKMHDAVVDELSKKILKKD